MLENIKYRKSLRARRLRIIVRQDCRIEVVVPARISMSGAQHFAASKIGWIKSKISFFEKHPAAIPLSAGGYADHKERARKFVASRLDYFNRFYGFSYNRIAIRACRSRWGSCSSKRNLNFNYKIIFLSPEQSDYIIVHELCHLKEMNHSAAFWSLVGRTMPTYREISRSLRKIPIA